MGDVMQKQECPARLHAAWVALGLPPAHWACCIHHLEMSCFFENVDNLGKGHSWGTPADLEEHRIRAQAAP